MGIFGKLFKGPEIDMVKAMQMQKKCVLLFNQAGRKWGRLPIDLWLYRRCKPF